MAKTLGRKIKGLTTFWLFVLPALGFYFLFAIVPLLQGIWLSTTNWDGVSPWVPAQMKIADFETQILDKVKNPDDKKLLLHYYDKRTDQGTYMKQALIGIDRYRVQAIISATGFVNEDFKSVGIQNFLDIFGGKVDPGFFPQKYTDNRFRPGDSLDSARIIPISEWTNDLLPHIKDPAKRDFLFGAYLVQSQGYVLDPTRFRVSETDLQVALSGIPGLKNHWEALYQQVSDAGLAGQPERLNPLVQQAGTEGHLSAAGMAKTKFLAQEVYDNFELKGILADSWYQNHFKMGVLLFTVFFTFFNVLLVNLLAMLIALALNRKLKTRNLLRSVFFIPNVLSMILVAFIWQLVFTQWLPSITGIQTWLMDPELAPWLTVLVAVWQGVGYFTIIYLAGLNSIPQDVLEAASMDGASGFGLFRRITLPLLAPAVTICLFLSIAGALKTFDIIFALYPSNSTTVGVDNVVVNIFYDAFRDRHAGPANAKAVLLLAVIVLITGIQLFFTEKKEVEL